MPPIDTPATPETPAAAPENSYDAMSSVFDSLVEPASTEKVETPSETPPAEVKAETPPEEPAKVEEPPKEGEEAPKAEEPPKEDAEGAELKKRLDALEAKTKTPTEVETLPPVEATPPDDKQPPREVYSPEEKTFLAEYQKEWPDVTKGEALLRRVEYQQLVAHVFSEIARVYGPMVERGVQAAETVGDTATLVAIREVHNDYNDAMYDAVVEWAEGLTGYRQKLAKGVIAEGEPQDVIDLISEYKSAKGLNKPKVVTATPVAPQAVTELSATAKKAAKALGVVDSKRTAVTPGSDPNDFDAAWDEAVSK
jgi:hypothetical protein